MAKSKKLLEAIEEPDAEEPEAEEPAEEPAEPEVVEPEVQEKPKKEKKEPKERAPMTPERKAQLLDNLKRGREKARLNRMNKKQLVKENDKKIKENLISEIDETQELKKQMKELKSQVKDLKTPKNKNEDNNDLIEDLKNQIKELKLQQKGISPSKSKEEPKQTAEPPKTKVLVSEPINIPKPKQNIHSIRKKNIWAQYS